MGNFIKIFKVLLSFRETDLLVKCHSGQLPTGKYPLGNFILGNFRTSADYVDINYDSLFKRHNSEATKAKPNQGQIKFLDMGLLHLISYTFSAVQTSRTDNVAKRIALLLKKVGFRFPHFLKKPYQQQRDKLKTKLQILSWGSLYFFPKNPHTLVRQSC